MTEAAVVVTHHLPPHTLAVVDVAAGEAGSGGGGGGAGVGGSGSGGGSGNGGGSGRSHQLLLTDRTDRDQHDVPAVTDDRRRFLFLLFTVK